jgi:hypothetical protein
MNAAMGRRTLFKSLRNLNDNLQVDGEHDYSPYGLFTSGSDL